MRDINLCVVAGTHGDEYGFGKMVHDELEKQCGERINFLIANPQAGASRVRFIDTDLNRSFGSQVAGIAEGNEATLAGHIKDLFKQEGFTHVVDIHTSPTTHSVVPIIPGECIGQRTLQVVDCLDVSREVVMIPVSSDPTSLVGAFGEGGIGLECPRYNYTRNAAGIALALTTMLQGNAARSNNAAGAQKSIFDVVANVPIGLDLPSDIPDFTYDPDLGGYHFVTAPSIYKRYPGYTSQGMIVRRR